MKTSCGCIRASERWVHCVLRVLCCSRCAQLPSDVGSGRVSIHPSTDGAGAHTLATSLTSSNLSSAKGLPAIIIAEDFSAAECRRKPRCALVDAHPWQKVSVNAQGPTHKPWRVPPSAMQSRRVPLQLLIFALFLLQRTRENSNFSIAQFLGLGDIWSICEIWVGDIIALWRIFIDYIYSNSKSMTSSREEIIIGDWLRAFTQIFLGKYEETMYAFSILYYGYISDTMCEGMHFRYTKNTKFRCLQFVFV